jgi:hypothetical protein
MPIDPHDDELAERGRALIAAAVADTRAPLALRERIEADRRRAAGGGAGGRRVRVLLAPALGVAAAVAVALVVLVGGGGTSPTVFATASLAARGPVLPAPKEDPSNHALLKASVEGVPFPYWSESFQWKAVGARADRISGRTARTVYYESRSGVRAAYTILGGDAVHPPSGAREITDNGIELWVAQDKGRRVITWQRGSHTCVMSAPLSFSEARLVDLASWTGKGKVPF